MDGLAFHHFDHFFRTLRSVDHNLVGQDHFQGAELDDELLESLEVQIMDLPFVENLDIDVSDQSVDLRLRGQIEESIILQKFTQLNGSQDLLSALVILDGFDVVIVVGVHGACVEQEEMPEDSVVLFEDNVDSLNLAILKLIHIDKAVFFGVLD